MKRLFLTAVVLVTAFFQAATAQDTANKSTTSLLSLYYELKDALVEGNASTAALKAGEFVKVANATDYKRVSEGNISALVKDASSIAKSKDLSKQRAAFENFSTNMIAVAKNVKLSDQPIYQAYCPMKKASWLSKEKAIRNPYYGSSMLTCGEVTETIQ